MPTLKAKKTTGTGQSKNTSATLAVAEKVVAASPRPRRGDKVDATIAQNIKGVTFGVRGMLMRQQLEMMELDEVIILEPAEFFDQAIIGLTEGHGEPRLIYDSQRCVEALMKSGIGDEEDALEFFEFNTLGAYIKNGPLFVNSLTPMGRLADEKKRREKSPD